MSEEIKLLSRNPAHLNRVANTAKKSLVLVAGTLVLVIHYFEK